MGRGQISDHKHLIQRLPREDLESRWQPRSSNIAEQGTDEGDWLLEFGH